MSNEDRKTELIQIAACLDVLADMTCKLLQKVKASIKQTPKKEEDANDNQA